MEVFQLLRSWAIPHVFSILAQPLGWVQRLTCALWALFQSSLNLEVPYIATRFNPHPTFRLGAAYLVTISLTSLKCFNPPFNLKVGWRRWWEQRFVVSILTQPLGRVQHSVFP